MVGLARSGLAAGRALAAAGERVTGIDSKRPEVGDAGFEVVLGTDGLEQLRGVAAVVKSPGVPPYAPVVAAAREAGLPVLGEVELAWRLSQSPVVAVTGTNGKTTVTEWLGHALRLADRAVAVAGNVGTPYITVADAGPDTTVIAECSSYQLADTLAFRPEIGVLLNLGSDHLDWHGSVEEYTAAKLDGMFSRQQSDDLAVLPAGVGAPGAAGRVVLDDIELPVAPSLPGAHNVANARAVVAVCRALGISEDAIAAALTGFAGVEHRLEYVATRDGVRYINDSKATNVASTLTALEAMDAPVHLILGGDDAKQEDFSPLRAAVAAHCISVQLIGEAAGRLLAALGTGTDRGTLDRAVSAARGVASPGEVVLLSPACASFDQYSGFEERGARFKELVA